MMTTTIGVQFASEVHPMSEHNRQTKSVATVRDVARMVGLSPARFYQLQQVGVFPFPVYDINTRRPFYTEEQQLECLEIRRRNFGANGRPVLFYSRRHSTLTRTPRPHVTRKGKSAGGTVQPTAHAEFLEAVRGLGLTTATAAQVTTAIKELFPVGIVGVDEGEVIRAVFIHLRRQNSGDSVGG